MLRKGDEEKNVITAETRFGFRFDFTFCSSLFHSL